MISRFFCCPQHALSRRCSFVTIFFSYLSFLIHRIVAEQEGEIGMKPNNRITFRFEHKDQRPAKPLTPGSQAAGQASSYDQEQNPAGLLELSKEREKRPVQPSSGQKEGMSSGSKVVPLYGLSTANSIEEVHPWNSPYQDDVSALEQLIRGTANNGSVRDASIQKDSGQQSSVHEAQTTPEPRIALVEQSRSGKRERLAREEPSTDYAATMPSEEAEGGDGYGSAIRRASSPSPSWLKVVFSVAGALLTGALFGYLLLALFIGPHLLPGVNKEPGAVPANAVIDPEDKEASGDTEGNNGTVTNDGTAIGAGSLGEEAQPVGGEAGGANAGAPMVSLGDVSASYTFLQFGVFSQEEGRDAALAELRGKKLPAVSYDSGKDLRVFAGIANGNAMAEGLIKRLPDLLLYKKEMAIDAPDKMPFSGKKEDAGLFFARTNELLAMWCSLTEAQLEQSSLSALGSAAAAAWKEKLELWRQSAATMKEGLPAGDGNRYFEGMSEGMLLASDALNEYDKKPGEAALRKLQEGMLKAVVSQKEWFESMSAL
jgi:hypothetical protein